MISLITSAAAIFVAVAGILGTSYNRKRVLKAEKSLEDFKVKLEREKIKYQLYSEELKHSFSLMGEFMGLIQAFKDYILMIQTSNNKIEVDILLSTVSELKANFFSFYQKNSQFINNKSLDAAHTAKHIINELDSYITQQAKSSKLNVVHIGDDPKIKSFHSQLSDCQNTLRDARMEIISITK